MIPDLKKVALADVDPFIRERVIAFAAEISEQTGVSVGAIMGRLKLPKIVAARNQLMVRLWREGLSLQEVGMVIGRDHTSVMHGLRKTLGREVYQAEVLARYPASRRGSYRGEIAS